MNKPNSKSLCHRFILAVLSFTFMSHLLFAQKEPVSPAKAEVVLPTKEDSVKIEKAALDYVEGFFTADAKRMAKAIHPELAKRIILKYDAGDMMIKEMGYSELLFNTARNKNQNVLNPDQPFKATVTIFEIYRKIATVKVSTNKFRFIDYLHMGKIDGEWKIINVLWELTGQ